MQNQFASLAQAATASPSLAADCCKAQLKSKGRAASNGCAPVSVGSIMNGESRQAAAAAASTAQSNGVTLGDDAAVKESVSKYYGEELKSQSDLKTSACCTATPPPPQVAQILRTVPDEVLSKYYGCGSATPLGIEGLRVLDLGCGSGRDCYVCSALVGEKGFVTGVDMTPAQLAVANKYVKQWTEARGYSRPNLRFVHGEIEDLATAGIADESVDIVISNCVLNLSPNKGAVLREVYRALAPGGEMFFSDVYCARRLPATLRTHHVLLGECLGGALYINDFHRLCREVGFTDPRRHKLEPFEVHSPELRELLGEAKFFSITYRLFKLPGRLEDACEDYGQVAVYRGSIPGHRHSYALDHHHLLVTGKPMLVCGNTASMLEESWLRPHFTVTGNRDVHYGLFPCGPPAADAELTSGSCCV